MNGEEAKAMGAVGAAGRRGEAPVVFSAEQALGGKRPAIEVIKLAGDDSRLCCRPLDAQQLRADLMAIAR
ncbi:uncharacterized protein N7458_012086 [Penicillium daleae]|uniref:Uncharacterized protein n=1 Tax=Penicillium daleae TaxID=63821 RepID=A0AAD6FY21_9EURO|nr:uncharacterized protein N7458_012086 [Penicillium daleae]KAJ5432930.1 hypothetical protein N7458_012086 [Penicillium daleae]